jgi:hypothetical protein
VRAVEPDKLMLFREKIAVVRTVRNTQIHSLGRMQNFGVLQQALYIVTIGL